MGRGQLRVFRDSTKSDNEVRDHTVKKYCTLIFTNICVIPFKVEPRSRDALVHTVFMHGSMPGNPQKSHYHPQMGPS